jgi:hypothetical protein
LFERPDQSLSLDHLSNERTASEDGQGRFARMAVRIAMPVGVNGSATQCPSVVVVVHRLQPALARRYVIVRDTQCRVHGWLVAGVFCRFMRVTQAPLPGHCRLQPLYRMPALTFCLDGWVSV